MRLSTYSDYSLRVLMHAALRAPDVLTINDVVDAFHISRNHLVKIVHHLGQLGYIQTRRGCGGGFVLGRAPEDIRIGQVIRDTEASVLLAECFDPKTNTCCLLPVCGLKGVLKEAAEAFFEALDRYTLADLIRGKSKLRGRLGLPA